MADTQHDARVGEDSSSSQTEESRSPEASGDDRRPACSPTRAAIRRA